jgi:hypothetical protein
LIGDEIISKKDQNHPDYCCVSQIRNPNFDKHSKHSTIKIPFFIIKYNDYNSKAGRKSIKIDTSTNNMNANSKTE